MRLCLARDVNCFATLRDSQHLHISVLHLQHTQKGPDINSALIFYRFLFHLGDVWHDSKWLNLHFCCLLVGIISLWNGKKAIVLFKHAPFFCTALDHNHSWKILPCHRRTLPECHKQRDLFNNLSIWWLLNTQIISWFSLVFVLTKCVRWWERTDGHITHKNAAYKNFWAQFGSLWDKMTEGSNFTKCRMRGGGGNKQNACAEKKVGQKSIVVVTLMGIQEYEFSSSLWPSCWAGSLVSPPCRVLAPPQHPYRDSFLAVMSFWQAPKQPS